MFDPHLRLSSERCITEDMLTKVLNQYTNVRY